MPSYLFLGLPETIN